MNLPGTILMGAQDRLLDPTIPYRYFAAALAFHVVLWVLIALNPAAVGEFFGGPGPALAALHGLTLGVLSATALGAAFQMLPVATGVPLRSTVSARLVSWLYIPGTAILLWGMHEGEHLAMAAGGIAVVCGFAIFVILVGEVLWKAAAFEAVRRFGLMAMIGLALTVALGMTLIVDDGHGILEQRLDVAGAHVIVAVFDFMGMLAFGFSHILIPLFALAQGVPALESRAAFGIAVIAIGTAAFGTYLGSMALAGGAAIVGIVGAVVHFRSMWRCLRGGMRKNLGVSMVMIVSGWGFLIVGLVLFVAFSGGWLEDRGLRLSMFFILFGWLLTFLLGVLQRILPFLGAMNAIGAGIKPPRPSELAPEPLLRSHAALHFLAIVLFGLGMALEDALFVLTGAIAGVFSALVFAGFAARVWWMVHGRSQSKTKKETI